METEPCPKQLDIYERIKVIANESKTPKSQEPDFRIFGERLAEVGAGWNRSETSSRRPA